MQNLPPMSDREAVAVVKRVAARYAPGTTLQACSCSACETGVRASRAPDGLCATCWDARCNPYLGHVACRPGSTEEPA